METLALNPLADGARRLSPSRLRAAAVALVALAALALPLPAAAQTVTDFVSNTGQSYYRRPSLLNLARGQRFTTGSHASGYILSSIQIRSVDPEGDAFSVSLCRVGSDGFPAGWPNTSCTALRPPSSFAAGFLDFTTPANTVLSPNTTYTLLVAIPSDVNGNTPEVRLGTTQSNNEDAGASPGWSIANDLDSGFWGVGGFGWQRDFYNRSLRIVIRGTLGPSSPIVFSPAVTSTPSLTSAASSTPDTYGVGETIRFTVTFSAAVTVTGDPEFGFSLGNPGQTDGTDRRATYDAGRSTANTLVFGYTVQAGDEDTDGIWVGDQTQTFKLDADDRIRTTSDNEDVNLNHVELGTLSAHKVGTPLVVAMVTSVAVTSTPSLTSAGAITPDTYGRGETIRFTVTFSEAVTVTGSPELQFFLGNSARRAAYDASLSMATTLVFGYTVQAGDRGNNGIWWSRFGLNTFKLDADDRIRTTSNDEDVILDSAGKRAQSGHKADGSRTGRGVATVTSVAVTSTPLLTWPGSSSPDTYEVDETIRFTVTFSEAVTVTGDPEFEFSLSNSARRAAYDASLSMATTLVFGYTVQADEEDRNGIWVGDQTKTIKLDADDRIRTTLYDALLEHNTLNTLSGHKVGTPPVVATVSSLAVTSTPSLTSAGATTPDTYGRGETIRFTVTFSEAVTVTGDPELEFFLGNSARRAAYDVSLSMATTLVFGYTVRADDEDTDGILVRSQGVRLDHNDSIRTTQNGEHAILNHAERGTLSGHKVDGSQIVSGVAVITSVAVTSTPLLASAGRTTPDTYGRGETIRFTVTFSEAVTVTGDPKLGLVFSHAVFSTSADATYDADQSTAMTLVFVHTVRADDRDTDGILVISQGIWLDDDDRIRTTSYDALLDNNALKTGSGHKVNGSRTAFGAATITSVVVTSTPRLTSAGAITPDTYGRGETIRFTLTFSEAVTVTGDPQFEFSMNNLGEPTRLVLADYDRDASMATTLVFGYTVQASDADTDGILVRSQGVRLDDDDRIRTPAHDVLFGHAALNTRSDHKVDGSRTASGTAAITSVMVTSTPRLTSAGASMPDTYGRGETIRFTVTFSTAVRVTGDPQFEFSLGNSTRRAAYDTGQSMATTLVFGYTVQAGDEDTNGIWVGNGTQTFKLDDDDRIRTEAIDVQANLDHAQRGTRSGHKVNGSRTAAATVTSVMVTSTPRLTSAGASTPDTYGRGETIRFTVTFSEAVRVTGDPEFEFLVGNPSETRNPRRATYDAGQSMATTLVFGYTVQAGDEDTNGIWVGNGTQTFKLDADDRIRTEAIDVQASLNHGARNVQAGHKMDGSRTAGPVGRAARAPRGVADGPTANFSDLPATHDGATAFTVKLSFSAEPRGLSYKTVRDSLLEVTGGTVTKALRVTDVSDREWNVTVKPSQGYDITLTLPAHACSETAAVCIGGRPLSRPASATIAGKALTASLSGPAEHDGSESFKVRLTFSMEPDVSYKTVRDTMFTEQGGTIKKAGRVAPPADLEFDITVEPDGDGAVSLSLASALPACGETGAVCTAGGRKIEGTVSATIPGPVAISVADAAVREGSGAVLAFEVTLDRARGETVTVDYATVPGNGAGVATEGSDYTATSGTLTFAANETLKTVSVPVLVDGHDEDAETMTLTLASPSPSDYVRIADGTATGTITNTGPMPGAWLARFGRTVGSQVLEAVSERLDGGPAGSHLNVGGVSLGGGTPLDAAAPLTPADWLAEQMNDAADAQHPEERTLMGRELLLGSSFHLVSRAEAGSAAAFSAWGRVSTGGFRAEVDEVTMDGDVTTGLLGFDAEWERLLAGLVLAHSEGDGAYGLRDGGDQGRIKSSLTGLYPYARLRLGGRVSLWGLAGAGNGDLRLLRQNEAIDTGLGMRLGAIGVTGTLPAVGGFDLAVKSDALWVRTESDAAAGLAAATAQVSRLRLILEAGRTFALASGAVLAPTAQVGLRHDGGDAETGTGIEVGAGIRYTAGMLTLEGQVRTLLAHEAGGYEEWGANGSIRLSPNASGLGPSLALLPSWGAAGSAVARLWAHPDASALVQGSTAAAAPGRLDAEFGWGLPALRGRGVLTPYARLALAEGDNQSWHLGTRLALAESLNLSLEGSRRRFTGGDTAHDLTLRASLPW